MSDKPELIIPVVATAVFDLRKEWDYLRRVTLKTLGFLPKDKRHMDRQPTTPGDILLKEYLDPMQISIEEFAERIGYQPGFIQMIIDGTIPVSVRIALVLSRALGTTPEFWINMQLALELWEEQEGKLKLPKPLSAES
jgi:addiction module HigA family antidote